MSTRAFLTPLSAHFPSTNFPALKKDSQDHFILAFDGVVNKTAYWELGIPQGWTAPAVLVISARVATATTGTFRFIAAVEAVSSGDSLDTDSTSSFDSNNSGGVSAPGVAGYMTQITITLTANDSASAGDFVRIKITRDASGSTGTDDISGSDVEILMVELRDAA